MHINYYKDKRTIPSWIKWSLLIFVLFLAITATFGMILYKNIQNDKVMGYSKSEKEVLNETDIVSIDKTTHFYGEDVYHIIFGSGENDKKEIAFIRKSDGNDAIVTFASEEFISESNIQSIWKTDCSGCELIKITPAMIDKKALWEVTYKDNNKRYIIDYLSMQDGTRYEQYRFKPTFN